MVRNSTLCFLIVILAMASTTQGQAPSVDKMQSGTRFVALATASLDASTPFSDLTLTGTGTWFEGGTQATGTVLLEVRGASESHLEFHSGHFSRVETRNESAGPQGEVVDSEGSHRQFATHNCWSPGGWFSPHSLVAMMSRGNETTIYVGQEQREGLTTDHLTMFRIVGGQKPSVADTIRDLSTVDIFLDPITHLPLTIVYQTHPDTDYSRNIPVEVRFGDYQEIKGVNIPRRIQRLVNGTLNLDITVSDVIANGSIPDSTFSF